MSQKVKCELCKKTVPSINSRYIPKGEDAKMLICCFCFDKRKNLESTAPYYSKDVSKKQQYFCGRCKYNFRCDTKTFNLRCPYCGKSDQLVERKEKTAAELLNSLEE